MLSGLLPVLQEPPTARPKPSKAPERPSKVQKTEALPEFMALKAEEELPLKKLAKVLKVPPAPEALKPSLKEMLVFLSGYSG